MSAPPPKVWTVNPAVVTLCLLIAGIVAGGAYYLGQRDTEAKHILERVKQAEDKANAAQADAAKAKQIETYNAGAVDATKGHVKPVQPKKQQEKGE